MRCHAARIGVLKALIKKDESAILNSVEKCIPVLAQHGELAELIRIRDKFKVNERRFSELALSGLSQMSPESVSNSQKRFMDKLVNTIGLKELSDASVRDVARVLAVHGLTEPESRYLSLFKERLTDGVLLIGLLRKLKEERKYVWNLYLERSERPDPPELTRYMSTVLAANGWADRVEAVLHWCDPNITLSFKTVSQFIRAFTHFPSPPQTSQVVWRLLERYPDGMRNPDVREAVAEFYLVNGQFGTVMNLIDGGKCSERLAKRVLRRTSGSVFLSFLHCLRDKADERAFNKGVDVAVQLQSGKRLVQVLESLYARRLALHPVQEASVRELVESPAVPFRVRKRLSAIIDLILKNSDQFIQPIIPS